MANQSSEVRESASVVRRTVGPLPKIRIVCSECGGEVDIVETNDPNEPLVEQILNKSVKNRNKSTYECPNGHNEGLEVG